VLNKGKTEPRAKWARFNRIQRGGWLMYGDQPHPKGVFRFKTWREFNEWKSRCWIRFSDEAAAGKSKAAERRRTPKRKRYPTA